VLGVTTVLAIGRECQCAWSITADVRSFLRLATDILLYRVLRVGKSWLKARERTIRFRNGAIVTYRLNRGDIQGIREVWFDQNYRLPLDLKVASLLDLGANIGLTSLYLAKTYGVSLIVAVEPNPANVLLTRRNLSQNGIKARVIEAAVGPRDGVARFSDAIDSNLGSLSDEGREVRMISIPTLCFDEGIESIDLLKMDIEGGEQALLSGEIDWINSIGAIIAEFHPDRVDYPGLTERITNEGFTWIRAGTVYRHTCDTFIRSTLMTQ
jgi:FkbM family methyltransferase